MDDQQFQDRLDEYIDDLRQKVAEHGWVCQGVFGPDGNTGDGFVYTIGLYGKNKMPELMLTGYFPDLARILVSQIVEQLLDKWIPGFTSLSDLNAMGITVTAPEDPGSEHTVSFRSWSIFDKDRPSMANNLYDKAVPYLHVDIAGWPCPRCTPLVGANVECTCRFSCWYKWCGVQDAEPA